MISWKKIKPEKDCSVMIKYSSGLIVSGVFHTHKDKFYYVCHCGKIHYTNSNDIEAWCFYEEVI